MFESPRWQEHHGEIRIPIKQYTALVGAAMTTLYDLEAFAQKARIAIREGGDITQASVEKLREDLMCTKARVQVQIEAEMGKSADAGGTKWDTEGYARGVTPSLEMVATPQAVVDLTQAAIDRGTKSARLLYELMIAEMEVAVTRWYVSANAMLTTSVPLGVTG